jgi:hypothetical protein
MFFAVSLRQGNRLCGLLRQSENATFCRRGAGDSFGRHFPRRVSEPRVESAIRRKILRIMSSARFATIRSSSQSAASRCRKRRRNSDVWRNERWSGVTSSGLTLKTCAAAVV